MRDIKTKKFIVLPLIIILILLTTTAVAAIISGSSITKTNNSIFFECEGRKVGEFNRSIAVISGHNPFPDPSAKCIFHYETKYDNPNNPFTASLGRDLYCNSVKVGSVSNSVRVEEFSQSRAGGCSWLFFSN